MLEENETQIHDPGKIAEIFNGHFSGLAEKLAEKNLGLTSSEDTNTLILN